MLPGLGALLTLTWLSNMGTHCSDNVQWDDLTADERTLPYFEDHGWCDEVGGLTGITAVSLIVTVFAAVAGFMASCLSMDLYTDEELDKEDN